MLLTDGTSNDDVDLEALEMCIRSSMHTIGSKVLEGFINADGGGYQGKSLTCDNGHTYEFSEYRKKEVMTVLGTVAINRAYYYDRQGRSGICPKDKALDIERGQPSAPESEE